MTRPGPKPLPAKVLELHGEDRRSRVGSDPPAVPFAPVEKPDTLASTAVDLWDRLVPMFERMGLATPADADRLALLCNTMAVYRIAARDVAERGPVFDGERGRTRNPAQLVMLQTAAQIMRMGEAFGMSPADRAALARDGWVGSGGWRGGRKTPPEAADASADALLDA